MNVHMMAIQMVSEVVCSQALHVIIFLQHTAGSVYDPLSVWECFQLPGYQVAFNAASLARQNQYSLRDIPSNIFDRCIQASRRTKNGNNKYRR